MNFRDKRQIRQEVLKLRGFLSDEEVTDKSKVIFDKLLEMDFYVNSKIVMCYMDFRNEVATREFIKLSLSKGKRIALPLIDKVIDNKVIDYKVVNKDRSIKENRLVACEIKNIDTELEKGVFGILEPKKEHKRILDPADIDLIIVPGVAFDLSKNRIGYGAGYYDRFLKSTRKDSFKVGVAFELQVLQEICTEKHDVLLDMIITEKRVISWITVVIKKQKLQ